MEFGSYEREENGRLCFRPSVPVFPPLESIWDQYEAARRAVEAFDLALTGSPVRNAVGRLFARHDAVHSSGAEGATTTFTDLLAYQSVGRAVDVDDAVAVAACAQAFEQMAENPEASPREMALAIHRRLFEQAPDPMIAARAGLWKAHPNATFDSAAGGSFHYTHPRSVPAALAEWEAFSVAGDSSPQLVRQGLSHWMFEHIHPFDDGNGRTGRLLVPLLMKKTGATRHACVFMGEAVHQNKGLYVDALKNARRIGDFFNWSRVCLALIRQTAEANVNRLHAVEALSGQWTAVIGGLRRHAAVHRLVPFVLTNPVFTVTEAAQAIGGTFQTVNTAVDQLLQFGIIRQRGTEQRRGRLFVAPEVLALFEPASEATSDRGFPSSFLIS
ncbi:MAG TPA: Fic family protein [Telmatospirillum sp.]|nr:Fic family protein [Telmatospirillum sp.]